MKKALSFAVALGLVAGLASVASAENMLSIHGDARLRGVYSTNTTDADDTNQDKRQRMDQRYRLTADVQINDAVKVNTRIQLASQLFGNNNPTAANATTGPSSNGNGHTHPFSYNTDTFTADRYNMVIKALGGTLTLGRQDASWGNKFLGWGVSVDRIKYTTKMNDMTVGGYLQKNVEGDNAFGDGDNDTWGALAIGKAGDTTWGVLLNYNIVDTNAAKASGKDTGYLIDPFFTTKVGPASVMGEFVYKGGDSMENSNGDAMWGGFVAASMGVEAATVKGLIAYYDRNEGAAAGGAGRDCDDDFAPSLLIGTCNETAIIDFGGTTQTHSDSTYLVGAGVDFKVNDKLQLGALLGYLMASEKAGVNGLMGGGLTGEDTARLIEVDLTAQYQLAQNTTYNFGIAYGDVDNFSTKDDAIFVVGNRVDVKW
jgi:hypothetical protein